MRKLNDSLAVIAAILAFSAVTFAQTYGTPGYAPGTWKPQELPKDLSKPKPFNPRELLGRIKAILRRSAHAPRDPSPDSVRGFCFGGWRLDTVTRTLTDVDGKEVALSGAEYRLLAVLLGSANRVLTRAQLTELLRGRDADPFDRSIDVRVSRLRQILGDDARAPQIIKTVYGEGYVIGVNVASD